MKGIILADGSSKSFFMDIQCCDRVAMNVLISL